MNRGKLAHLGLLIMIVGCSVNPTPEGGYVIAPVLPSRQRAAPQQGEESQAVSSGVCHAHTIEDGEWLAARVVGFDPGSRVNIRSMPAMEAHIEAKALVGDDVAVLGESISRDCTRWYQVHIPRLKRRGWIHSDYIEINP